MGLFQAMAEWRLASHEKKVARNRERGTCPECRGLGFYPLTASEYMAFHATDGYTCQQCNGSGMFTDWEQVQSQF